MCIVRERVEGCIIYDKPYCVVMVSMRCLEQDGLEDSLEIEVKLGMIVRV